VVWKVGEKEWEGIICSNSSIIVEMKILIIEDEVALRIPLRKFLEKRNFLVDEAEDGREALDKISIDDYDCILLDLNIPEIDGIEVCNTIRNKGNNTPIIMITARSQMYNKLEGFGSGADDYLTKPFDLKELVARITAVIKRSSKNKDHFLKFGGFRFFPDRNIVIKGKSGIEVELSNKETSLLEYLLRNRKKIVSAEELLEHVWGRDVDMFSETVKAHIKTLRKKVDTEKRVIKTFRGKGYMIN